MVKTMDLFETNGEPDKKGKKKREGRHLSPELTEHLLQGLIEGASEPLNSDVDESRPQ